MQDPRSLQIMGMAVALAASGNPEYCNRQIADIAAELCGSLEGVDTVFGYPPFSAGETEQ